MLIVTSWAPITPCVAKESATLDPSEWTQLSSVIFIELEDDHISSPAKSLEYIVQSREDFPHVVHDQVVQHDPTVANFRVNHRN